MTISRRKWNKTVASLHGLKKMYFLLRPFAVEYEQLVSRGFENEHRFLYDLDRSYVLLEQNFFPALDSLIPESDSLYDTLANQVEENIEVACRLSSYIYGIAFGFYICVISEKYDKEIDYDGVKKYIDDGQFNEEYKKNIKHGLTLLFDFYNDEIYGLKTDFNAGSWELGAMASLFFGTELSRENYADPRYGMAMYQALILAGKQITVISRLEELTKRGFFK